MVTRGGERTRWRRHLSQKRAVGGLDRHCPFVVLILEDSVPWMIQRFKLNFIFPCNTRELPDSPVKNLIFLYYGLEGLVSWKLVGLRPQEDFFKSFQN